MTFAAHHSTILFPGRFRPHSVSGWADGYSAAPLGTPQHPALLDGYGPHRPPWNVAGVDYRTGIPEGAVLTDWRKLSSPQLNVNLSTGLITLNGDYTFNNIDFSPGIGAIVRNQAGKASNITFKNCYFFLPVGSPQAGAFSFIVDQGPANIILRNCFIDGLNMTPNAADLIDAKGSVDMQYCWFINARQHILSMVGTAPQTLIYKYNMVDNGHQEPGAHRNWLQWVTANVAFSVTVQFNTCYQYTVSPDAYPGEGFQFYNNGGQFILTNPMFTNNTIITKPVPNNLASSTVSVSSTVHGPDATDSVSGGINNSNYFDLSGTTPGFAYYIGTMVPSRGFTSSGNIDMNAGAIITPT